MKGLIYTLLKPLIQVAFFCYYQEIRMVGIGNLPKDRPVLLLPNHQNALLDPLLIAAFARVRRPYFLTRSDVFQGRLLREIFDTLRMMPIYRIRDGRSALQNNQAVFDQCARLLAGREHLLLFPEANHNIRRRVRPLSKGFTRIIGHTLDRFPGTELQLVPVGLNYQQADGFPDRVAFYFGDPIAAGAYWDPADPNESARALRAVVRGSLCRLTTHIDLEDEYRERLDLLEARQPDWLDPVSVNRTLAGDVAALRTWKPRISWQFKVWDLAFRLVNLPVWILWKKMVVPRIWEPEFTSTFRFAFSLVAFPIYFLAVGLLAYYQIGPEAAIGVPGLLWIHNLLYVKLR